MTKGPIKQEAVFITFIPSSSSISISKNSDTRKKSFV